ncbi:hypothetical protein [Desulfobacula sp.]
MGLLRHQDFIPWDDSALVLYLPCRKKGYWGLLAGM